MSDDLELLRELIEKYDNVENYDIEEIEEYNEIELHTDYIDRENNFILKLTIEDKRIENLYLIHRTIDDFDDEDKKIIMNNLNATYILLKFIYYKYNFICKYNLQEYLDHYAYMCPACDGIESIININNIVKIDKNDILNFINFVNSIKLNTNSIKYKKINNILPLKQNIFKFDKKAKRVKYFFEIIKLLQYSSIPIFNANIILEQKLSTIFESSNRQSGLIEFKKTKKLGYSAKPYINTLKKLNILQEMNEKYILDKTSKWFLELEKLINSESLPTLSPLLINSVFELNLLEKYFFLKNILKNDFYYLYEILEIIYIVEDLNIQELSKIFFDRHSEYKNMDYVNGLVSIRVHWLYDLGFLSEDFETKKRIILNENAKEFFKEIISIRNIYLNLPTSINAFLQLKFTKAFAKLIGLKIITTNETELYIKRYISKCYEIHKRKFDNRAILSSIINSIIFLTLINEHTILEYKDVKDIILNTKILRKLGYSFAYSQKESDGYIKRG